MTKEQMEQLEHLFSLHKRGIITKEELEKEKEKILNTPPPPLELNPNLDPLSKSKIVAGVLGILLGGIGIHRFYLGFAGIGILQIFVTICTCGVGSLWGLIEGILILVGGYLTTDSTGRPLKD
ncbi:MAG: TM2 domain-containing protein [Bacteroidetes bacterium]|nr:TM2 domain-containing protein [Bacteroidota bacterium]